MSTIIDERVTEMRFDNRHFESNVQTTLSTLDKLKRSLNLSGASKGLETIESTSGSLMSNLGGAVDSVRSKFSALEVMGLTALVNITNSAVNAGKRIVSALTIDPIKTGFEEYETQINAVQTILANTESKGSTLDDVNNALNELNKYADMTIYNFTEMTRNIGTFTAAGVDLDTSVSAIKGIANLAAVSGSNSQQASTAMYQLSQALAAGTVKLQDWNSVVNAGMGGQVFQDALKETARVHGVAIDQMIEDEGSFRETLSEGWLTSEILTETLSKFTGDLNEEQLRTMGYTEEQIAGIIKMGQTANDAATKVKTVTQLMDTLKEAAQSGWTQSWQIIIGDFEEAKELLTKVSDVASNFINNMSNARNEMLQGWKDLGGRTALIESLENVFVSLYKIIKPITEAFREIFPPMTGEKLFAFTDGLRKLTENMKISDKTAENIKRTFRGLFTIVDAAKNVFLGLVKAVSPFVGVALKVVDVILSITAVLGDYISNVGYVITKTDAFTYAFKSIGKVIEPVITLVKNGMDKVKELFDSIKTIENTSLDGVIEKAKSVMQPFAVIGETFKKIFEGLSNVLGAISDSVKKALDTLGTSVVEGMDSPVFNQLLGFLNGGLIAGILYGLKKIIDSFRDISSGGGFLDSVIDILDGVKGTLSAYQSQLKADALIKIATAIAILSVSLLALGLIDPGRLTGALAAMGGLMWEMYTFMKVFDKMATGTGFLSMTKTVTAMLGLSTAVLILSGAMKVLGDLSWEQIGKGLASIAGLSAVLVTSAHLMSKSSGKITKTALGLVVFSYALKSLVDVVRDLGEIDADKLLNGLIAVGVLCASLALFLKTTDLNKMGLLKGAGLMLLAQSLVILTGAVERLSQIDSQGLIKGVSAVGVILLELAAFSRLASGSSKLISTSVALIIVSNAISMLSTSVQQFSQMNENELLKGIGTLGAILTELMLFTKLTSGSKNMISIGIGLGILGYSIGTFAKAVADMSNLSWEQVGKGLTTMAGTLTSIAVAMRLMPKNMIFNSVGMLAIAKSLTTLQDVVSDMGGMTWEQIGKGLATLAGSMAILSVSMLAMKGALPGAAAMLVLAGALKVFVPTLQLLGGMSLTEIGTGLLALAGAFAVIGVAGLLLAPLAGPLALLGGAITLLGVGCLAAGTGVLAFATGLAALAASGAAGITALNTIIQKILESIPLLLIKIGEGIVAFAQVIIDGAPVILEAVSVLITGMVAKIVELTPTVVEAFFNLVMTILQFLSDNIGKFIDVGSDLLVGFLQGIARNIGDVVEAAIDVVLAFIEGVRSKVPEVVDAAIDLVFDFVEAIITGLGRRTPDLINCITTAFTKMLKAGVKAVTDFVSEFISAGADLVAGLAKGIANGVGKVVTAISDVVKSAIKKGKDLLDINSPSRVFAEMGMYCDEGLAGGLTKYAHRVVNATESLGRKTVNTMRGVIESINFDAFSDDGPTITPVFDMSLVEKGVDTMNSLFKKQPTVDVALAGGITTRNLRSIPTTLSSGQNDTGIIDAIKDLKNSISNNAGGNSYNVNGITYDDGSNVSTALKSLVRAARIERRT